MDGTNIIPVNIESEMRGSYLDYAMSVIIGRALPDVRDGLKPVHRRILYAMLREGLLSSKKFSKCAGVVGEVLKHYHPHGDSPVYGALVRMAQSWNLRYPLIDGQGNFGSIDGDSPAAYRYTECRMTALAETLLADIDRDTVDFTPNFDESVDEPVVLPSRIPNLLINGSEGIAVGMASSIPPHNLREVIQATLRLIEEPATTVDELMEYVPGPDFPTAGTIHGLAPIRQMYRTGRGLLQLRGRIQQEKLSTGKREVEALVIDQIPYQVNKARLVEKIAELVNEKKIEGISKLRDESDRRGMRIVIELKRDASAEVVMNTLYKLSPLQRTVGVIMLAIVDGRPRVLTLKEMLQHFIDHRRTVVVRRTRFELQKARARLHILEGLRIALQNIDEIVQLIKRSESTPAAKEALIARFSLSEIQAQHILDMPLRRLTGLERQAIEDEYREVLARIEVYLKILGDPKEVDRVVSEELQEISDQYGDERRTQIEQFGEEIDVEDMIADDEMVVTISHKGYAKRCSLSLYRAQRRGGRGILGNKRAESEEDDFITDLFVTTNLSNLMVFTSIGKAYLIKVYQLPETERVARGRAIVNMITLSEGEKVSAVVPVRKLEEGKNIIMATQQGYIKRVNLMEFINIRRSGMRAIFLDEGDKLIGARISDGTNDCLISSAKGMSIRFTEEDVRIMGRSARGVTAINLDAGDEVVSLETVPSKDSDTGLLLFTACQNGYGKRTFVSDYRPQSRAGKGLIDIKTEDRNGPVVVALQVHETDQVMIITSGSQVIRVPVSEVPLRSRNTMGVRLVQLTEGERICAMARIVDDGSGLGEADLPEGGGAEVTPEVATEAAPESEEVSDSGDLPTDVH